MPEAKQDIVDKITQIVERAGKPDGVEPVEVVWSGAGKQRLLRITIDKPGGVTHGDCEAISHYVGTVLDAEDVLPGGVGYRLEVSSPGVERKLTKPADYQRFAGQKIKAVLRQPVGGRTVLEGVLESISPDLAITIRPAGGEPIQVSLDAVTRANLKFEW